MNQERLMIFAALIGGIVGLAWALSELTPLSRNLALLGILSAGVLLLIEAVLLLGDLRRLDSEISRLQEKQPAFDGQDKEKNEWNEKKEKKEKNDQRRALQSWRNWLLRIGVLLVLIFAGFILFFRDTSPNPHGNPQSTTVRFSDQVEKALTDYLASTSRRPLQGPPAGGVVRLDPNLQKPQSTSRGQVQGLPAGGVVRLDPSLEAALRQHLQNPPAPAGIPRWVMLTLIVLVLAVLIGLIWWSLSSKPEVAPLPVAIATLTAVSGVIAKLAGEAQIPAWHNVPWLVLIVSVILLFVGVVLLFTSWQHLPTGWFLKVEKNALLASALLIFGFSAVLLAFVPPLLLHGEDSPPSSEKNLQQEARGPQQITVSSFNGIDNLGDGRRPEDENIDAERIKQVRQGLKNAGPGDILLLFGSADCVPTRPKNKGGRWDSNEELAKARAYWIKTALKGQPEVNGIDIETQAFHQQARCGPGRDVRAVYPFLIHGENK